MLEPFLLELCLDLLGDPSCRSQAKCCRVSEFLPTPSSLNSVGSFLEVILHRVYVFHQLPTVGGFTDVYRHEPTDITYCRDLR